MRWRRQRLERMEKRDQLLLFGGRELDVAGAGCGGLAGVGLDGVVEGIGAAVVQINRALA